MMGMGFILSMVGTDLVASNTLCQQHHCLGVVDAGSTGSRLHFYVYDLDSNNNPIQVEEKWSKKVKPGFSLLDLEQATVDSYLTELLPDQTEQGVPVYFYATAGMRLLSASKQQSYYHAVETWFAKQSTWHLMEAKTINGRDEGVFGWLAVNYRLGTLTGAESASVGVMDTGGASVQVVFPIKDDDSSHDKNVVHLTLYEKHIALFSHSWLGLGQTLVSQQFLNHSICFPNGYPLPDGLLATGDAQACQEEIAHLINDVHHVSAAVKPRLSTNPPKDWYVMGGLAHSIQSPLFHMANNQMSSASLIEQADSAACQAPWTSLLSAYPKHDMLYLECLNAAYYYALLVQGYGLMPKEPIHLVPGDSGNDWTLGVVLHQS